MCLICIDLAKKTLTPRDARRHLGEMRVNMDKAHVAEVEAKIAEAEKTKTP
jgi:hypothetical protein